MDDLDTKLKTYVCLDKELFGQPPGTEIWLQVDGAKRLVCDGIASPVEKQPQLDQELLDAVCQKGFKEIEQKYAKQLAIHEKARVELKVELDRAKAVLAACRCKGVRSKAATIHNVAGDETPRNRGFLGSTLGTDNRPL